MTLPEILTTSRFYLELKFSGSTAPDAYFMECQGMKYSQDVIEAVEVTPQKWGKASRGRVVRTKIPGNYQVTNLTLKRGMMTKSTALWQWMLNIQEGKWAEQRVGSGALTVYMQDGQQGAIFTFTNAWPVSYTFSDTNVGGNELAVEELELAVEDFKRTS